MGNRIVQLSENEYDRLQKKAELNDTKIRDLAEKYYQERGVCLCKLGYSMDGARRFNCEVVFCLAFCGILFYVLSGLFGE